MFIWLAKFLGHSTWWNQWWKVDRSDFADKKTAQGKGDEEIGGNVHANC